jgi:hypothetical protein
MNKSIYLFICLLNNPKAIYNASKRKLRKDKTHIHKHKREKKVTSIIKTIMKIQQVQYNNNNIISSNNGKIIVLLILLFGHKKKPFYSIHIYVTINNKIKQ